MRKVFVLLHYIHNIFECELPLYFHQIPLFIFCTICISYIFLVLVISYEIWQLCCMKNSLENFLEPQEEKLPRVWFMTIQAKNHKLWFIIAGFSFPNVLRKKLSILTKLLWSLLHKFHEILNGKAIYFSHWKTGFR